ncbi:hypothetical protein TNCV_3372781 [Trichonephila clavipes]|nr:hypothetical protein TNCV_3372781 [Trichonephila clavipes]
MARQLTQLPDKLWKPTLASRAAPKNGRTGPELCSFPVLPFFWGSSRSLGCSQWVACPAEGTGITHVQVLQQLLQVKPMATVYLFWPVHRTQTGGEHSPQSLNEGSFSFGSLLLQVVTGHVLWFKTSKGSDARNVQKMMMREHFGQQLHKTLFSVGVEVNNLGVGVASR